MTDTDNTFLPPESLTVLTLYMVYPYSESVTVSSYVVNRITEIEGTVNAFLNGPKDGKPHGDLVDWYVTKYAPIPF